MSIGDRLKAARSRAGLSEGQARRLLDISSHALWAIESTEEETALEMLQSITDRCFITLQDLASLYGVSAHWLRTGEVAELDPALVRQVSALPVEDQRRLIALLESLGSAVRVGARVMAPDRPGLRVGVVERLRGRRALVRWEDGTVEEVNVEELEEDQTASREVLPGRG